MSENVRWSLVVSKETDISLRSFLAHRGMRKGELSKFVEEAVRWRVLDKIVSETRAQNADVDPQIIEEKIDEALRAVRAERFRTKA